MIRVKEQTGDDAASQDTYDVGAIDTLWKLHCHHRVGSSCVPELKNTTTTQDVLQPLLTGVQAISELSRKPW